VLRARGPFLAVGVEEVVVAAGSGGVRSRDLSEVIEDHALESVPMEQRKSGWSLAWSTTGIVTTLIQLAIGSYVTAVAGVALGVLAGVLVCVFGATLGWLVGHISYKEGLSSTVAGRFYGFGVRGSVIASAIFGFMILGFLAIENALLYNGTLFAFGWEPNLLNAVAIYGILTETSIAKLFIAGILPGLLTVLSYLAYIAWWSRRDPRVAPPVKPVPVRECVRASSRVWPALLLVVLMVVGIYTGVMTATEAGAVGAFLALILSVTLGKLRRRGVLQALTNTLESTGAILFMIIGGAVFAGFLTLSRVTQSIIQWVTDANLSPLVVITGIVVLYLVLGMFMDMIVMLTLSLPLTFPLAMNLGYDPIWFGILVIKLGEVGLITPPFGLNVFVASKAADGDIRDGFAGAIRFLVAEVFVIIAIIAFPAMSTWLPGLASD
jgi:TRAP-type C4-dicarboxylate transport system permease large subunit